MENPVVALPPTAQVSPEENCSAAPRRPSPTRSAAAAPAGTHQPGCDVLALAALLSP